MFSNFKISSQRENNTLKVKLEGDFNASSALQLLYYLRTHRNNISSIVVDTSCLHSLEAFGLNLFRYQLRWLKIETVELLFTGTKQSYFMNELTVP